MSLVGTNHNDNASRLVHFQKTSWVKKFCVLYQATTDSNAFIEMYEDQKALNEYKSQQKYNDTKKIVLRNFTSVRHLTKSSTKESEYLTEIRCKSQKYVLMFNNEYESNEWQAVLRNVFPCMADNEVNSHSKDIESYAEDESEEVLTINKACGSADKVQKFIVEVEPSNLAHRCGIVGKMTILIKPCILAFEDFETMQTMCNFDVNWIHKFGVKKSQFHFEVGKQCLDGKGTIVCNTENAKLIHQIVQDMSKNAKSFRSQNSIKEVKASKKSAQSKAESDKHDLQPSLVVQPQNPETSSVGICAPIFAPSISRQHLGHTKTPMLLPIMLAHQNNDAHSITKKKPSKDVNSKEIDGQDVMAKGTRSVISKFMNDDFSKELERIFQNTDAYIKGTIRVHSSKKEREMDKNDKEGASKKWDKEDKREKERHEKEEKKEREKLEKEKRKEKEERKKSIHIMKDKLKSTSLSRADSEAIAELSQPNYSAYAECGDVCNIVESVADCAIQDVRQNMDDGLYEDAMSIRKSNNPKQMFSDVVYAEPLATKGGVHISGNPGHYTEVNTFWKDYASIEDEHHENDYLNLQMARRQMMDNPSIPQRQYNDEYDDNDDTYDKATLKYPKNNGRLISKQEVANENLYGMTSRKKIGLFLDFPKVPCTHSHESIEEAENAYEGYNMPEKVKAIPSKIPYVQCFEDRNIKVKPKLLPKPTSPPVKSSFTTFYEDVI